MSRQLAVGAIALLALATVGCGGGGGGGGGGPETASVTTGMSDPASCKKSSTNSSGFESVVINVADVKAHTSADTSLPPSDSGFVDLTPDLAKSGPVQVDLLGSAGTECFLKTLQSNASLTGATFQQIRFLVSDSSTTTSPNLCAGAGPTVFNCVIDSNGNSHPLSIMPSEINNGLKIPPGQLAGGNLTVANGQSINIDIDFNACESIIETGSGKFKLKPTLRASEVGTNPEILGTVVAASVAGMTVTPNTAKPVAGANVWLESPPASAPGTESLVQTTQTDSTGTFSFCPVAPGTFDIVAASDTNSSLDGAASNPTITTGVAVTSSGGPNNLTIPLVPEPAGPAAIFGQVTTQASSGPGSGDDVTAAALESFGSPAVQAIIPFIPTGTIPIPPTITTSSKPTNCGALVCPGGTLCECYTLSQSSSNLVVGTAANATAGGTNYAPPASGVVRYSITGSATLPGTNTPDCANSPQTTSAFAVIAGGKVIAPVLSFTGCQ